MCQNHKYDHLKLQIFGETMKEKIFLTLVTIAFLMVVVFMAIKFDMVSS